MAEIEIVDEEKKIIRSGTLIHADKVDSMGDYFPREVLEKAAKEANERMAAGQEIWAQEDFRDKLEAIQGKITEVSMGTTDMEGMVEVMKTPAGLRVLDLEKAAGPLVIAIRGLLNKSKTVERDGVEVKEIQDFDLTGVSVIPESKKVK